MSVGRAYFALFKVRILGRPMWWAATLLLAVVLTIELHEASSSPFEYGPTSAAATPNTTLRLLLPGLLLVWSSISAAFALQGPRGRETYLARTSRRRLGVSIALTGGTAGVLVLGILLVYALLLGLAFAHGVTPVHGVPSYVFNDGRSSARNYGAFAAVIIWSWVGAAIGVTTRNLIRATAGSVAFLAGCLLLERLAVTYSWTRSINGFSLMGATNGLLVGSTVPEYSKASVQVAPSVVVLIGWFLAAACVVRSVDSHRNTQTKTRSRLAGLGPKTTGWLIAIPLLILFGYAVPSIVQQRIPWQFQSNWLTLRAKGDTPSAAVRTALGRPQRNPRGSVRTASPSVDSELQALRQRIADRNLRLVVSDVLSASSPGSVVADLGNERTTRSGAIVPPDQVGFCLIREGDDWVITSVSPKGTTC